MYVCRYGDGVYVCCKISGSQPNRPMALVWMDRFGPPHTNSTKWFERTHLRLIRRRSCCRRSVRWSVVVSLAPVGLPSELSLNRTRCRSFP